MQKYAKIITADNTETFLNTDVNECYHSQTGAVEEALQKYAVPCKIRELARKKGSIRILDFCFGLGYNSAMAISEALEENPDCEIEVIGLEKDSLILEKIQAVNPPISFYKHYKQLRLPRLEFRHGKVQIKVILGDARETTKQLADNYFDAVFYDPFSPKTSPEMWEVPLFQDIWRVMKESALLATYSCARMARENMSRAGLVYEEGPVVGRRGPGTVAWKWV